MCHSSFCIHAEPSAVSRRQFLRSSSALALTLTAAAGTVGLFGTGAWAAGMPKPGNALSPDEAIQRLADGNTRYVSGVTRRHDFAPERRALAGGQNPYAAVLGCADSRVVPEYAFDCARGDLFVNRVAGNLINDDMLGSLEYGVAMLGIPVILVLGHERCGAVDATVKAVRDQAQFPGHIQTLVDALTPAVQPLDLQQPDLLETAIEQNVRKSMADMAGQSTIIAQAQQTGKLKIIGGVYRLETGKVDFLA